eukprot:CAMPEP_0171955748 /NCGR_PEP_ID=MMETSP0993-20121228/115359_1 /TAXON_ID=483369 /ORGANISM="non described non described, Strain CCMP2098" /LENGTH=40 /DNA_ID= /DNA_START= /DNA_END= /DNA_ORIENTATION=
MCYAPARRAPGAITAPQLLTTLGPLMCNTLSFRASNMLVA